VPGQKQEVPKLPHNFDAERAVLGVMMLNSSAVATAFSLVTTEEFFSPQHQGIYRAMQALSAEGREIDLLTVTDQLERQGKLAAAGGAAYVAQLIDGVPSKLNIAHYAAIVREKSQLRRLAHFCEATHNAALSAGEKPDKLIEGAVEDLLAIATSSNGHRSVRKWYDISQSAIEQVRFAREHPDKAARLYFGLSDLDRFTSGLRKGELVVIVGPTSHGKSILAEQLAISADERGHRGLIFSAEMSAEELALRQIAFEAKVPFYDARRPERLDDSQFGRLAEVATRVRSICIVDRDISPMAVWALSEAHKRNGGLDLVVVDYDQLVIETGISPDEDERSFFAHQRRFVLEAARLAKRLDVCFVLLCQLRKVSPRIVQGGKPTLDDIYGDSSIRNTPHLIIWIVREFFIHNLDPKWERKVTVYVVKARNDRAGRVRLDFDPERLRLADAPPSEKDSVEEAKPGKKKRGQEAREPGDDE
jgi:replicative DNA helicase